MNIDQVREIMNRLGDAMLEVLDADSDQCAAWNRRGGALIDALVDGAVAASEIRPAGSLRSTAPLDAARVVRQCSAPRLDLPSSRDADEPVRVLGAGDLDEGGVRCGNCLDLGHSAGDCPAPIRDYNPLPLDGPLPRSYVKEEDYLP